MDRSVRLPLEELFRALDIPQMEEGEGSGPGRPGYPSKPMLNALILMPLSGESESELARILRRIPSLAEECGFKPGKTPSQPTINRFKHRLGLEGFKQIFRRLVRKLIRSHAIKGISLVLDATDLEAYKSDSDAKWGYVSKGNAFYGYKIHLIADFKAELPIEIQVTPANIHENELFKPLLKAAKRKGLKASRICGDAIHDNKATRSFLKGLCAKAFIDHNPRRAGAEAAKPKTKTYKRLKASVERIFSRAKELLGLRKVRVRGFTSVSIHIHLVFIAMLSVAIAADGNDMDDRIRCIKSIF